MTDERKDVSKKAENDGLVEKALAWREEERFGLRTKQLTLAHEISRAEACMKACITSRGRRQYDRELKELQAENATVRAKINEIERQRRTILRGNEVAA